jgi:hypothetical protein
MLIDTGSKPIPSLERLPRVRIRYLPELPALIRHLPFLILAPIKVIHQVVYILLALLVWIEVPPEFIVVQVRFLPFLEFSFGLTVFKEPTKHTIPCSGSISWTHSRQQGYH